MTEPLIDHVAILVPDLEQAVDTWTRALGYRFTPVMNYRTQDYVDSSSPEPHFHDARFVFSMQGPPFIELMEFTGEGTHSSAQGEGFHHLGFRVPDAAARQDEMAARGVGHNGASLGTDGAPILWFTDPDDLNRTRLEYVGADQQPVYGADGSLVVYDPDAGPDAGPDAVGPDAPDDLE